MGEILAGAGTLLAGVGALAAWRHARGVAQEVSQVHVEVKTNHGHRAGEYLEMIHADLRDLRELVVDHIRDKASHN
jgi:hypothetical protein